MVGIFSRFYSGRGRSHRRTIPSMDEGGTVLSNSEINPNVALVMSHGVETVCDFKPIEHPTEPPDNDPPVTCPAPEPSISNVSKADAATVLSNSEINPNVALVMSHGVETVCDFKPIEHPTEPPDNDPPVTCPAPEPSISNDGKMWRERLAANSRRQSDVSILKDEETQGAPDVAVIKYASAAFMLVLLPVGVPEEQKCETSEEV